MATKKTTASKKRAPARASAKTKSRAPKKAASDSSSAHSQTTTDHDKIRQWAEDRGAHPACVRGTGDAGDIGMLRLDFPGYSGEGLEEISWDEFFDKFEENRLALVYQEETAEGERSNFNKIVSRETSDSKPKTRTAG